MINISELHSVLIEDLFRQYESSWATFPPYYFESRSSVLSTCLANLPGNKIAIGFDRPDTNMLTQIRKSLLFSDHIIIRHKTYIPSPRVDFDATVPVYIALRGLEPIPFVEKHLSELKELPQLPYFGGNTVPIEEAHKFLKWLKEEGKLWAQKGLITYAPILPSEHLEMACSSKGLNLNKYFLDHRVLPQQTERYNEKVANALQLLEIPYLENIDPDILIKVKNDNKDALQNFQSCLIKAFDEIEKQKSNDNLQRSVNSIFADIVSSGATQVNNAIKQAEKMRALKIRSVVATTFIVGLSFWVGAPAYVATAALAKPVWDFANAIIDHHKELVSIKDKPMYILSVLKNKTARRKKK